MLVCLHLFVRASVCACVCLSVCLYASLSVCVCRLVCLHVCVSCQSKFGTGALRPSIVKELYSRIAARNQVNCRGSNWHSRMTHHEGMVSLTPNIPFDNEKSCTQIFPTGMRSSLCAPIYLQILLGQLFGLLEFCLWQALSHPRSLLKIWHP